MSQVQLFAVNNSEETVLLQLTDESPLKVTLSVASLDAFTPSSYFSQTFVIPGVGANLQFFKDVYSVNGYSFDSSKTAKAWINNNGFLFSIGNLNLKSVIINEKFNTIEYEVFFMGDTSDFSASVGNNFMNTIDTAELNHELTYANVTTSWNAAPGSTAGFKDGNVLYPLVEWGYNYNSANFPINATISTGFPRGSTGTDPGGSFTNGTTGGLSLRQLKPAVRTKWLWDKIFADAGYTYTSDFLNSELFDQLYFISDSVARTEQPVSFLTCEMAGNAFTLQRSIEQRIPYTQTISNPALAYDPETSQYNCIYAGNYTFNFTGIGKIPDYDPATMPSAQLVFDITLYKKSGFFTFPYTVGTFKTIAGVTGGVTWGGGFSTTLDVGDSLWLTVKVPAYSNVSVGAFSNQIFRCLTSPSAVIVSSFFPPQGTTKKIDFIRGITKMFNLVFIPGRDQAKTFQIEPWVDWIQKGKKDDWTEFLDGSSDSNQHAPFLDQSRAINFTSTDDSDFQNTIYQEQFKRNFMFRQFESGINLIKGTDEIKLPFAPTPLESMPNKAGTSPYPNWVVPTMAKLLPGNPEENKSAKVQPIQPKPRILFYNGKISNPIPWYLNQTPTIGATGIAQTSYPLVSEFQQFPPDPFTLDLSFQSKTPIWSPVSTLEGKTSSDLYTNYWGSYIDWLYDPYNRKKTVTMRLSPYQIETIRFNDPLWVKDSWYFVQKIQDYPVGESALVRVELIKVPTAALPHISQGATAAPEPTAECKSVAICNNSTFEYEQQTFLYADCDNNLRSLYLPPLTCTTICLLWPSAYELPANWTGQVLGNCGGGPLPPVVGPINLVDFAVVADPTQEISLKILASTGGTAGPYVPIQYFNTLGNGGATGIFVAVPDGYGLSAELTWVNAPPYGFVEGEYIFMYENGVMVDFSSYTGFYNGPIGATFPAPLAPGNEYQITSYFNATGPFPPTGCPIWSIDTDTFGSSTTIWNECPNTVWNTDPDDWNLSTTIWNI